MKVVIVSKKEAFSQKEKRKEKTSLEKERLAIRKMTSGRESVSYREAMAANVPVTYVSKGKILRVKDGDVVVIGHVAPMVKIDTLK